MADLTLRLVKGESHPHQVPLDVSEVILGAAAAATLRVGGQGVSRRHARIYKDGDAWAIEDLESKNGTYVNGKRIQRARLVPGARIQIMQSVFTVEGDGAKPRKAPKAEPPTAAEDVAALKELRKAHQQILEQMGRVIVGQQEVMEQLLVALFARGHCLIQGVPGLAKTLMVRTLSTVLQLDGNRVQFTPDLMPSDITGTEILEEDQTTKKRIMRFVRGPIFTNVLLADEINRTPPKTQAALLEAMQEYRVTTGGDTLDLPQPFFVLATQNPLEQEGTYPLPEAQLDRFMFMVRIGYPGRGEEVEIIRSTTMDTEIDLPQILSGERILASQKTVRRVPVSPHVATYAADLVRATRPEDPSAPKFVKEWLSWGGSPRAGQYLLLAAKARAALDGRWNVTADDVRANALPVLRHRISCNFNATSQGVTHDDVVKKLLQTVHEPSERDY
jgi:MoxR-like ATPase